MAEQEPGEDAPILQLPVMVPDYYTDGVGFELATYTATLMFSVGVGTSRRPVATVRMSPAHVKVLTIMLRRFIKEAEQKIGEPIPIPKSVLEEKHISLDEDW